MEYVQSNVNVMEPQWLRIKARININMVCKYIISEETSVSLSWANNPNWTKEDIQKMRKKLEAEDEQRSFKKLNIIITFSHGDDYFFFHY